MIKKSNKIILPGGAGLIGQNLVALLIDRGYENIVVLDKHKKNLEILKTVQPGITTVLADLATPGSWQKHFEGADVVVMLQAQIGGLHYEDFFDNNVTSTKNILGLIQANKISNLVHISSSVVKSESNDFYTRSKVEQERVVVDSGIPCQILRPTLMFGWFDRKHLGWLSRLMKKSLLFPIPGNGKYIRQPLYAKDFCRIIISCLENKAPAGIFNISGREKIYYIDMIQIIKRVTHANAIIMRIPYRIFYTLLWIWALFDKNPPFTTQQLQALVAKDEFEVIDWPDIFGVPTTSFESAIDETFNHPVYKKIVLEF